MTAEAFSISSTLSGHFSLIFAISGLFSGCATQANLKFIDGVFAGESEVLLEQSPCVARVQSEAHPDA